ncbi:MAG: NAD(P)/FAD-dependent oxidoreductase [Acidobacteriia bacterium]|nr:NAD(P)/FAD-dependent oxidoreductase [Terriglobia bacterium]
MAAERLARGGARVVVFEEKLGREKPCGGGLTAKALRRYPFLLEAAVGARRISQAEFIAATGESVRLHLRRPVAVCSRSVLNQRLLERAARSGAEVVVDRVVRLQRSAAGWELAGRQRNYRADFVVLAAGARSRLRPALVPDLAPKDFMLTFGYYVPGAEDLLRVQFLENIEGYAWAFPRPDHLSVGICAKVGEEKMAEVQARLHHFMEVFDYRRRGARMFAHLLPALTVSSWSDLRLAGDGWALAGDASGLVDPLTGEGIYFAMRSGELLGECLSAGEVAVYPQRVWEECGSQLAHGARLTGLYYRSNIFGKTLCTRMIQLCRRSDLVRDLLQDLVEGTQPYAGLLPRLYRGLGASLVEIGAQSLTGMFPRSDDGGGPGTGESRGPFGTLAPE